MPAYVVAFVDVTNPEGYKEYIARVPATIAAHGGRYLGRSASPMLLEGGPAPGRAVVLEFPSVEAARRWYDSPEYAPLRVLRQQNASGTLVLLPSYSQ